jgi:hypothetical protein
VALEVPDWLRVVEVPEPDGWLVELEQDDDGSITTVAWTAEDTGEPAPVFDLDVVAEGDEGAEVNLGVYQGCDEASYRWVGTPAEPADDPAVNVTLTAPDPDSPPPPVEEPQEPVEEDTDGPDPLEEPAEEPATDEDEGEDPADEITDEEPADEPQDAAAAEQDDAGLPWGALLVLLVVVAGGAAVLAARRRKAAAADAQTTGPETP